MSRLFAATSAPIIRWFGAKLRVRPRASHVAVVRAQRDCGRTRQLRASFAPCAGACAGLLLLVLNQSACAGDDAAQAQDAGTTSQSQRATLPVTATAGTQGLGATVEPLLACGQAECKRPKNVAAELLMGITGLPMTGAETVACCLDEEDGTCSSAASTGGSCDTVAVSDDRCPGVDLSALANLVGGLGDSTKEAMIGCCTHDMCGLDGKLFGRGCVENAEAKRMLSAVPVIGPLISVPPRRACADRAVAKDAGTKTNAGRASAPDDDAGA